MAVPDNQAITIRNTVDTIIKPLMLQYQIPGMAIAITKDGKNYFYNYGTIAKNSTKAVTSNTLFEVGSITKTFTSTHCRRSDSVWTFFSVVIPAKAGIYSSTDTDKLDDRSRTVSAFRIENLEIKMLCR